MLKLREVFGLKKMLALFIASYFVLIPGVFITGGILSLIMTGHLLNMRHMAIGMLVSFVLAALVQCVALCFRKQAVREGKIKNGISLLLYLIPVFEVFAAVSGWWVFFGR